MWSALYKMGNGRSSDSGVQATKAVLASRLATVKEGEEALSARIQQDQFYLQALRKKQQETTDRKDELLLQRAGLSPTRRTSKQPRRPSESAPPSARRGSARAASAKVICLTESKKEVHVTDPHSHAARLVRKEDPTS